MSSAFFGLAPQSTLGAHCGPAPGAGARLARPAGRRLLRFVCPLSPLGAGNTTHYLYLPRVGGRVACGQKRADSSVARSSSLQMSCKPPAFAPGGNGPELAVRCCPEASEQRSSL